MKRTSFLGVSSKRSCRSSRTVQLQLLQSYWLGHRIGSLILNGFPWKQTEIILSFLRLHPSTALWTLLLTMMATPFLLRHCNSRIPRQLEKNNVAPPSSKYEAPVSYSVSREVPGSVLKCESVLGTLDATPKFP